MSIVNSQNRVLITGAAGFIGFYVARLLLDSGCAVHGFDEMNDYYDVSLKKARLSQLNAHANFSFSQADLADQEAVDAAFSSFKPTHVVHLAAQAGVRYSIDNPRAYTKSNVDGTLNILEACRHNDIQHLVFASSSSVYGLNMETPFQENHHTDHPISLYAATKKANEMMAHTYAHLYNIPTTGLRFFTVYGPWGRPDMAYFSFTQKILKNETIKVFNNGDMKRDFTYIDDIVQILVRLIDKPATPSEAYDNEAPLPHISSAPYRIFNIGNSSPVELGDFISCLESALGHKANKEFLPMQPGDVYATYADNSRVFEVAGYKPQVNIEEGLQNFVDWYVDFYNVKKAA